MTKLTNDKRVLVSFVILIHPETIKVVPHTFKDKNERLLEKE
jgi:hypothetical protein